MTKIYTGIGSRETPREALTMIRFFSLNLIQEGYTLRSGGAPGADQEFEWGCARSGLPKQKIQSLVEIYLPWEKFEKEKRSFIIPTRFEAQDEAYEIAAQFHPSWQYLKRGARMLHARNVHQIYGPDVTRPKFSEFVICWTEDGKMKGGTAQALRIAQAHNIRIYNLAIEKDYDELVDRILS